MSLSRTEKALTGVFGKISPWFTHSITPEKPIGPDTSGLSAPDLDRFNDWLVKRTGGTLVGTETRNITPELAAMMSAYEDYFTTPEFIAWSSIDILSREMQWRLAHVDVAEAVNLKGTIPPCMATDGIGSSAPGVGDIEIMVSREISGAAVSTGGKSPEIVFGDDGDIVTTGE